MRVTIPHPRLRFTLDNDPVALLFLHTGSCIRTVVGVTLRTTTMLDATRPCFRWIVAPSPRDPLLLRNCSRVANNVSPPGSAPLTTPGRIRVSGVRNHTATYYFLPHPLALAGIILISFMTFQVLQWMWLVPPFLLRLMFPFQQLR